MSPLLDHPISGSRSTTFDNSSARRAADASSGDEASAHGTRLPEKSRSLLREGQLDAYELISLEKANYPVSLMCRVLGVSRSGYYAWLKRGPSKREVEDLSLLSEIEAIHERSRGTYGSPRVVAELKDKAFQVGRRRVARLMRENGLTARFKRPFRRTTEVDPALPVTPNTLDRRFDVEGVDQVWVTDITYLRTDEGWLYLAVVIDLFSRRVIGWSMANHLRAELALGALRMALGHRVPSKDLLHHSDRGCQYACHDYRKALDENGILCSMSRKGNCWDNAVAESFFGTLKTELAHRARWKTRDEARLEVHEYIEIFYNRQRKHSYLEYLSPVEFERRFCLDGRIAA